MSQSDIDKLLERRRFIQNAAAGTTLSLLGGSAYILASGLASEAQAASRADGRPRVPPGQRVLSQLKPMGGTPGDPRTSQFKLTLHGAVERPLTLGFADLIQAGALTLPLDVHCVTGWTVLGARFRGVRLADLARRAGVKREARHVILEAAHGYTANVRLDEALANDVLITWELNGERLARAHGGPVRAVVPSLYFWKSPKWLTGIRFSVRDEPGYWETRGYHNHADPWLEERHA